MFQLLALASAVDFQPFALANSQSYRDKFEVKISLNKKEEGKIRADYSAHQNLFIFHPIANAFDHNPNTDVYVYTMGSPYYFMLKFDQQITFRRILFQDNRNSGNNIITEIAVFTKNEANQWVQVKAFSNDKTLGQPCLLTLDEDLTLTEVKIQMKTKNNDEYHFTRFEFYKNDVLDDVEAHKVFADPARTQWLGDYQNESYRLEVIERIKSAPSNDLYLDVLEDMEALQANPLLNETLQTLHCAPGLWAANSGLVRAYTPSDRYYVQGESLTVYCNTYDSVSYGALLVKPFDKESSWHEWGLSTGKNKNIKNPSDMTNHPTKLGTLMFYCNSKVNNPPKCRATGGRPILKFKDGDNVNEFMNKAEEYAKSPNFISNVQASVTDLKDKKVNLMCVHSKKIVMYTYADGGLSVLKNNFNSWGKSVQDLIDEYNKMHEIYTWYAGYEPGYIQATWLQMIDIRTAAWAYCNYRYIAINGGDGASMLSWRTITHDGWGYYHEWGHHYDNRDTTEAEMTNNLYSLMMQRKNGRPARVEWIFPMLKSWGINQNGNQYDIWSRLAILRQLEIILGEEMVPSFYKWQRAGNMRDLESKMWVHDRWVAGLSRLHQKNLYTSFFKQYNWPCNDACKAECSKYPDLETPIPTYYYDEGFFVSDKFPAKPNMTDDAELYVEKIETSDKQSFKITLNVKNTPRESIHGIEWCTPSGKVLTYFNGFTYTVPYSLMHDHNMTHFKFGALGYNFKFSKYSYIHVPYNLTKSEMTIRLFPICEFAYRDGATGQLSYQCKSQFEGGNISSWFDNTENTDAGYVSTVTKYHYNNAKYGAVPNPCQYQWRDSPQPGSTSYQNKGPIWFVADLGEEKWVDCIDVQVTPSSQKFRNFNL